MQRQLQAETRNISVLGFGAPYIRDFTVSEKWVMQEDSSVAMTYLVDDSVNVGSRRNRRNHLTVRHIRTADVDQLVFINVR